MGETKKQLARAAWLASTCLTAIATFTVPARAQTAPAPQTTPQGGTVAAGSASIAQAPGSTVVTQSSSRSVINWQSFNIGSAASVQFVQPSSSAMALNRVLSSDPSVIAGSLSANGQLVLINQSGVVFTKGSQVNAESLLVTTSNIADKDFMAGHMVFSGPPHPGAQIINNGSITVRQAGLAGLVAPQVANNGVITAQLGQVVLAGASAFTLDLYGDRLVSLDVTQAVRAVDVGGKIVPALVTNRGLIVANGGTVTLTAQDADALVTQLIDAGGTIQADTASGHAGTIALTGIGGGITIDGNLLARGEAAGTAGGAVQALTTGTVSLAPSAVVDVSGQAGGGVVALGTDLTRAEQGAADSTAPRAAAVSIAPGAVLDAGAAHDGDGGHVVLLSSKETDFAGSIAVPGGSLGGHGGTVEISSGGVVNLTGTVDDTAAAGQSGTVLLDPATLVVNVSGSPTAGSSGNGSTETFGTDSNTISYLTPAALNGLSGTIILDASTLISVASALDLTAASALSLVSGGDVSINAAISVTTGALDVSAAGTLDEAGTLTAADVTLLDSGTGGVTLAAPINVPGGTFALISDGFAIVGGTVNAAGGLIESAPYNPTDGGLQLPQGVLDVFTASTLEIGQAGGFRANDLTSDNNLSYSGTLIFSANDELIQSGSLTASQIDLSAASLAVEGSLSASSGIDLTGTTFLIDTGSITALNLSLSGAGLTQEDGGAINAGNLYENATGPVTLTGSQNSITGLGSISVSGAFALTDQHPLSVDGAVTATVLTLTDTAPAGIFLSSTGALNAGRIAITADTLTFNNGGIIAAAGGTVDITPYTATLGIDLGGSNDGLLDLSAGLISATSAGLLQIGTGGGSIETAGAVTAAASTLVLDGTSISFNAALDEPGLLELASSQGIAQSSNGALILGTLAGDGAIGGGVDLDEAVNNIATLGGFNDSGQSFALVSNSPLTVSGAVSAATAQLAAANLAIPGDITATANLLLNSPSITLGGTLTAGGTLDLQNTSRFAEAASASIDAAALAGSGTQGDVTLAGSNLIASLGSFTADTLALFDDTALTVTGPLNAAAATLAAPGLTLASVVNAYDGLSLQSGGGIMQSGGVIVTDTLTGSAAGPVALTLGGNSIEDLDGFSLATGSLALADAGALTINGPLDAPAAALNADGLTFGAAVDITGALSLGSTGAVAQSSGLITAATLSGSAATGVSLTDANSLTTLANMSVTTGALTLDDTAALILAGSISAPSLSLQAGALSEAANATLTASTFTGSASGGISLASPLNSILRLAAVSAGTGTLTLDDASAVVIAGLLSAPDINLTDAAAGGIGLASNGSLASSFTGTIDLTADALTAATGATLSASGGTIAIAPYSADLGIDLGGTDGGMLDLSPAVVQAATARLLEIGNGTGALLTQNQVTATVSTLALAGAGMTLDGSIADPAGALVLASTGSVTQAAGAGLTAATLFAAVGPGNLALTGSQNSIAALGTITLTSGSLSLDDQTALDIAGPVNAAAAAISASALSLTGTLAIPGLLNLDSSTGLTETGAVLNIGTLAGAVTGKAALTGSQNNIASLADFTAGTLGLVDQLALQLNAVTLTTGSITAAGLSLAGNVSAATALTLATTGTINQNAGSLTAASLAGGTAASGAVSLGDSANNIAVLGQFTLQSGAALSLTDSASLTVTGPLTADTIALTAAAIGLEGNVTGGTVQLESHAGITQSSGTLSALVLTNDGDGFGTVSLADAGNQIASISNFVVSSGDFLLDDATALSISGVLSAALVSLTAPSLEIDGFLSGDTLDLASSGTMREANGGSVFADTLNASSIAGDLDFGGDNGNFVGTLGNVSLGGALSVNEQDPLTIAGLVTAGGDVDLTATSLNVAGTLLSAGTIDLDAVSIASGSAPSVRPAVFAVSGPDIIITGAVNAGSALSLTSTLGIDEAAGTLSAGLLTGTVAGGDALLTGNNTIATLGSFTVADGTLTLNDTSSLTVAGLVTADDIILSAASLTMPGTLLSTGDISLTSAAGIDIDGLVQTPTQLVLAAGDDVTETGTLITPLLSGTDTGGCFELYGTNSVSTLGVLSAIGGGGADLYDDVALNIAGPVTGSKLNLEAPSITVSGTISASSDLTLDGTASVGIDGLIEGGNYLELDGGAVIEPGTIIATTLTGTNTGGEVALTGSNTIATLDDFSASDIVSLIDTAPLTVSGDVTGLDVDLTAPSLDITGTVAGLAAVSLSGAAGIGLDGVVQAGAVVALDGDGITQTGGFLSTPTLNSSDGAALSLAESTNSIGSFGAASLTGTLDLTDGEALTIGTLHAAAATFSAPGLTFASGSGEIDITGVLSLSSTGPVTQRSGNFVAGTLTGSATGPVSLTPGHFALDSLANFSVSSGSLDLTDVSILTLAGSIDAPTLALDAFGFVEAAHAGLTASSASLEVFEGGPISLSSALNQIATITGISIVGGNGAITLDDASPLTITGPLTAESVSLTAPSLVLASTGSITTTGAVDLTGTSLIALDGVLDAGTGLSLSSQGNVTEAGATITAPTLSGTVAGSTDLAGPANYIINLGPFAGGSLDLADQSSLSIGQGSFTNATLSAPGLAFTGAFGAAALSLASATITESGSGLLTLGVLNADTGQIILGNANSITSIGSLTVSGQAQVTGASGITGPVTAASAAFITGGDFALGGSVSTPGALSVTAGGNISQTASVAAGSETLTAGAGINLSGTDRVTNALGLTAGGSITQTANIAAGSESLTAGGGISLSGTDTVTNALALTAGSSITATGQLAAGTLTGAADGLVLITSGAPFTSIGGFIDPQGVFSLSNTGDVTLTGPLDAAQVLITTTGKLTLDGSAGGGLFIAGTLAASQVSVPGPADSVLAATGGITQTGTFFVNTGSLANGPATLFLESGTGMTFAGLDAPTVDTVLSAQTGSLTGAMDVGQLSILSASAANLTGSIAGTTGGGAAQLGSLAFAPSSDYLFNACMIASTTCTIQTTITPAAAPSDPSTVFDDSVTTVSAAAQTAAATAPLDNFTVGTTRKTTEVVLNVSPPTDEDTNRRRRRSGNNAQLPGIATHDY